MENYPLLDKRELDIDSLYPIYGYILKEEHAHAIITKTNAEIVFCSEKYLLKLTFKKTGSKI